MRRLSTLTLAAIVLGSATVTATATAAQPTTGRLLVTYKRASAAVAAAAGSPAATRVSRTTTTVVRPRAGQTLSELKRRLAADPRIADVRAERRYTLRYVPNDPAYSAQEPGTPAGTTSQWWLQRSNFPAAWDLNRGSGANVAVIDTGVDAGHPELAGRIVAAADFDDDPDHGPPTTDEIGHGTHVASLACASSDNGFGIAGAGFGCGLLIAKSDLSESSIARSITWAVDNGAHAINMSFGTDGSRQASPVVVQALEYAMAKNVVLVAAAADEDTNEQGDPANVLQPTGTGPDATSNRGLSVTAASASDQRAGFAGRGTQISLAAYGAYGAGGPAGLLAAFPANETDMEGGSFVPPTSGCRCRTTFQGDSRWAYLQGTSMASPQVAAVGALARTLNPDLKGPDVVSIIKASARRAGGWTADLGWGILDAGQALTAVTKTDRRAPASRVRTTPRSVRSTRFTVRWSGSDRPPNRNVLASGIKRYELYRSTNGGPARRIKSTRSTQTTVTGRRGSRYAFFTVAVDKAGNREARPSRPDVSVLVRR